MAGLGETISDFFTKEAGQARRRWLDEQSGAAENWLRYYLGPTGIPDKLAGAAEAMQYSDAGDMLEGAEASQALWNDPSLENFGRYATAGAAMALPMVSAKMIGDGVDIAGDAARSLGDDLSVFWRSEAGNTPELPGLTRFADPDDYTDEILAELDRLDLNPRTQPGNRAWVTADEVIPQPGSSYAPGGGQLEMTLPGGNYSPPMSPAERARRAVPDDPDLAGIMAEGSLRYSPSRLASQKLKTKKGTYDQFRAELLKNGAKPDELVWSGFDKEFKGKAGITREQIQEFMAGNTDLVRGNTRKSSGMLGSGDPDVDMDDLRQRWVDDHLDGEIQYYIDDVVPQQVENDLTYLADMDDDELRALFDDHVGGDDAEFLYWKERMVPDGVLYADREIFPSTQEAIDDYVSNNRNWIEDDANNSLWESLHYGDAISDDDLRARYGAATNGEPFDSGETSFSDYFVKDVSDYQERTLHSNVGTRKYEGANAHFSDFPILHTRSGVAQGPDGKTLVAGEFQSDWAQRGRADGRPFSDPAQEMSVTPTITGRTPKAELDQLNYDANDALRNAWYDDIIDVRPDRGFGNYYVDPVNMRAALRGGDNPAAPPRFIVERGLDNYQPMTSQPSIQPEGQRAWDFHTPPQTEAGRNLAAAFGVDDWDDPGFTIRTDYVGGVAPNYRTAGRIDETVTAPDTYPAARYLWENRPMPEGTLWDAPSPDGQGWLPGFQDGPLQGVSRAFWDDTAREDLPLLLEKAAATEDFYKNTIASAPHVGGSTDKWALAAWRDTLDDAIQRGDIDRISLGTPDMASDMTMGTSGVGKFYEDILPKAVNKDIQKLYGKQFRLENYPLTVANKHGDPVTYRAPTLQLTPEFIEQVKKKGIPLFAGVPATAALWEIMAGQPAEPQT